MSDIPTKESIAKLDEQRAKLQRKAERSRKHLNRLINVFMPTLFVLGSFIFVMLTGYDLGQHKYAAAVTNALCSLVWLGLPMFRLFDLVRDARRGDELAEIIDRTIDKNIRERRRELAMNEAREAAAKEVAEESAQSTKSKLRGLFETIASDPDAPAPIRDLFQHVLAGGDDAHKNHGRQLQELFAEILSTVMETGEYGDVPNEKALAKAKAIFEEETGHTVDAKIIPGGIKAVVGKCGSSPEKPEQPSKPAKRRAVPADDKQRIRRERANAARRAKRALAKPAATEPAKKTVTKKKGTK